MEVGIVCAIGVEVLCLRELAESCDHEPRTEWSIIMTDPIPEIMSHIVTRGHLLQRRYGIFPMPACKSNSGIVRMIDFKCNNICLRLVSILSLQSCRVDGTPMSLSFRAERPPTTVDQHRTSRSLPLAGWLQLSGRPQDLVKLQ